MTITIYRNDVDASDTGSRIIAYAHMFMVNMQFIATCDDDATTLTFDAFDEATMHDTIDELQECVDAFVARDDIERDACMCANAIITLLRERATKH